MKTQKHKLAFGKTSLVELDNITLNKVNGGTFTLPETVGTFTPNTLPDPFPPFPNPLPDPFPTPIPIPGTGTLPW